MEFAKLAFVPMILFIVIVLPTWLNLHYRDKRRQGRELSAEEWADLEDTLNQLEKMEQRVIALEQILDEKDSAWRDDPGRT